MSGGNPVCGSTAGPPLDGPLASLLAARDAQDRQWATPALQAVAKGEEVIKSQAIVVAHQQPKKSGSKDADIQAILDGDF